jgi:hypothetical protein
MNARYGVAYQLVKEESLPSFKKALLAKKREKFVGKLIEFTELIAIIPIKEDEVSYKEIEVLPQRGHHFFVLDVQMVEKKCTADYNSRSHIFPAFICLFGEQIICALADPGAKT